MIVALSIATVVTVALALFARDPGEIVLTTSIEGAVVLEVGGLLAVVIALRRKLSGEIDRVASQKETLESQNDALRRLNRSLAEAQRVASLAYWEIGADGEIFWSDEMYRLCGLEPSTAPPPTAQFLEAVHPEDRPKMIEVARRAVAEHHQFTEQYRLAVPGKPIRTVQATSRAVFDENGERKLVGTVQDITDRAIMETRLRQSQKMEAVGQLAGGVAHDFNNILTVIEAHSTFALENPRLPDDIRLDVDTIRVAGQKAAMLTRQLLAFSRQQVSRPRVIDLNTAIAGIARMLPRLMGANIEIETQLARGLDRVKADPNQLEQVLINLAVNARDAMPDGGKLTIETANVILGDEEIRRHPGLKPGPHVMLAVSDTGIGMTPDVARQIFDPFFTTKEIGKGTGLGLATVHGIIEQSGGRIRVYSEPDHGTSFKVYLPRSDEQLSAELEMNVSKPGARRTGRILLVEDNVEVRSLTSRILRTAGYEVIEAGDGDEALAVSLDRDIPLDILITDMVMPGMSGLDLLQKATAARPGIKTLIMSGYTRRALAHRSKLTEEAVYIEKPFTAESLSEKVRRLLDGTATGDAVV